MTAIHNILRENAILKFGMKMTMKRKSSCVLLSVLSGIWMAVFAITAFAMKENGASVSDFAEAGSILFIVLASLHYVFCVFLAPAVSGSAISGEREKQTFDVMLCSQMTPRDIVWGKFLSSISWIILVSVSLLPSYAIIYIFGGVPVYAIASVLFAIIWTTAVCSAVSVMMSAVIKRTAGAIVLSIVTLFGLVILNLILLVGYNGVLYGLEQLWKEFYGTSNIYTCFGSTHNTPFGWYDEVMSPVLWFNPVVGFIGVMVCTVLGKNEFSDFFGNFQVSNLSLALLFAVNLVFYTGLALLALRIAENAVNPMRPGITERRRIKSEKAIRRRNERAKAKRLKEEAKNPAAGQ